MTNNEIQDFYNQWREAIALEEDAASRASYLYGEWEEAKMEEDEAAFQGAFLEEELRNQGIDPNEPPDWIEPW